MALSNSSRTPRTHVTMLPKGFIIVRILQFLFAVIVLAISLYATIMHDASNLDEDMGLHIIIGISGFTTFILIWVIVATYWAPRLYNYWAILAFEIFGLILWLFGLYCTGASSVGASRFAKQKCPDNIRKCADIQKLYPPLVYITFACCWALFFLYITSLTVVGVFIRRHRAAGGHSKIGSPAPRYGRDVALVYEPYTESFDMAKPQRFT